MAKDDTFQHLRVFEDVVSLVVNNYVEEVDVKQAMRGAMRGPGRGLDPDSAYLTPDLVKRRREQHERRARPMSASSWSRQYYLRVVSAREGSPAAKAGLRTGDFIRAIDDKPTRDMSAYEGARLLRGAPGSKVELLVFRGNAADPHEVALVRERIAGPELTSRMANATTGYVRVVEFSKDSPAQIKQAFDALAKSGATRYVDRPARHRPRRPRRRHRGGAAVRRSGTLAVKQTQDAGSDVVAARPADGAITAPVALLVDQGTAGAAEVFAAALDGNDRADLIGERTLGRAARQQLVKLPDGSGLLLSSIRYLTPKNEGIHERGLAPDVEVDQPDVEFGATPPATDETLDKALERLAEKKAA